MTENAETPRRVSGAFQEVSAAGEGLLPTVAPPAAETTHRRGRDGQ